MEIDFVIDNLVLNNISLWIYVWIIQKNMWGEYNFLLIF